ncbi:translocase subunit protein [Nymphaea thermarum]|nr:translocase subunit protein [Nymphaea thermarum]
MFKGDDRGEAAKKQYSPTVSVINDMEKAVSALSDEQLRERTMEFKRRVAVGDSLDSILPVSFIAHVLMLDCTWLYRRRPADAGTRTAAGSNTRYEQLQLHRNITVTQGRQPRIVGLKPAVEGRQNFTATSRVGSTVSTGASRRQSGEGDTAVGHNKPARSIGVHRNFTVDVEHLSHTHDSIGRTELTIESWAELADGAGTSRQSRRLKRCSTGDAGTTGPAGDEYAALVDGTNPQSGTRTTEQGLKSMHMQL